MIWTVLVLGCVDERAKQPGVCELHAYETTEEREGIGDTDAPLPASSDHSYGCLPNNGSVLSERCGETFPSEFNDGDSYGNSDDRGGALVTVPSELSCLDLGYRFEGHMYPDLDDFECGASVEDEDSCDWAIGEGPMFVAKRRTSDTPGEHGAFAANTGTGSDDCEPYYDNFPDTVEDGDAAWAYCNAAYAEQCWGTEELRQFNCDSLRGQGDDLYQACPYCD